MVVERNVAVVTGGNTGLGLETVKQLAREGLTVVLTALYTDKGEAAVAGLKEKGLDSIFLYPLDICSADSIKDLTNWLKDRFGGIDILVNNAGVLDCTYDYETAKRVMATNYSGTKNVTEALLPLFRASPAGARIVNATSRMGLYERLQAESLKQVFRDEDNYSDELAESLATNFVDHMKAGRAQEEGWVKNNPPSLAVYSESKMFMNLYATALAKSLAKSPNEGHKILVATFCSGLTHTDMFREATAAGFVPPEGYQVKNVEDGADTGVWLALLPAKEWPEKIGRFFGERTEYLFGTKTPPVA